MVYLKVCEDVRSSPYHNVENIWMSQYVRISPYHNVILSEQVNAKASGYYDTDMSGNQNKSRLRNLRNIQMQFFSFPHLPFSECNDMIAS